MKRIAVNYDTPPTIVSGEVGTKLTVIDDQEFTDFLTGRQTLSEKAREKIKLAMNSTDAKIKIYLAAYAHKGMDRLANLLRVLSSVESEMFQDWRIKTMDSNTLSSFLDSLYTEKSRSIKEISDISGKLEHGLDAATRELDRQQNKENAEEEATLSRQGKKNVVSFFKNKIAV